MIKVFTKITQYIIEMSFNEIATTTKNTKSYEIYFLVRIRIYSAYLPLFTTLLTTTHVQLYIAHGENKYIFTTTTTICATTETKTTV